MSTLNKFGLMTFIVGCFFQFSERSDQLLVIGMFVMVAGSIMFTFNKDSLK